MENKTLYTKCTLVYSNAHNVGYGVVLCAQCVKHRNIAYPQRFGFWLQKFVLSVRVLLKRYLDQRVCCCCGSVRDRAGWTWLCHCRRLGCAYEKRHQNCTTHRIETWNSCSICASLCYTYLHKVSCIICCVTNHALVLWRRIPSIFQLLLASSPGSRLRIHPKFRFGPAGRTRGGRFSTLFFYEHPPLQSLPYTPKWPTVARPFPLDVLWEW